MCRVRSFTLGVTVDPEVSQTWTEPLLNCKLSCFTTGRMGNAFLFAIFYNIFCGLLFIRTGASDSKQAVVGTILAALFRPSRIITHASTNRKPEDYSYLYMHLEHNLPRTFFPLTPTAKGPEKKYYSSESDHP